MDDTQNIGCCSNGDCLFKVEAMHGNDAEKLNDDNYLCPKCYSIRKERGEIIESEDTFKILSKDYTISKEFKIDHKFYKSLTVFFNSKGGQISFHLQTDFKSKVVWDRDLDLQDHLVYEKDTGDEFDQVFIAPDSYELKEDECVCEYDLY
jgi:hypothetical protein